MRILHVVHGGLRPNRANGVNYVVNSLLRADNSGNSRALAIVRTEKRREHRESVTYVRYSQIVEIFNSLKNANYIHFHSGLIAFNALLIILAKILGKKVVLSPHGIYTNNALNSFKKRIYFYLIEVIVLFFVDRIHFLNISEARSFPLKNKSYELIPNGVNIAEVEHKPKEVLFGFLGRFHIEQKGLDILAKAWFQYRRNGGVGTLLLAGGGANDLAVEALFKDCDAVNFLGPLFGEAKEEFFKKLAVFVHPSRWEGMPIGCLEAVNYENLLIVTPETNLEEFIQTNNVLSTALTINDLCSALLEAERIFNNRNRYSEMTKGAKNVLKNKYNWSVILQQYMTYLYVNK